MITVVGLLADIVGVSILFFNGRFARNFNRLQGFTISENDSDGTGGGMKAIEGKSPWPMFLDTLAFGLIVCGFGAQIIGKLLND